MELTAPPADAGTMADGAKTDGETTGGTDADGEPAAADGSYGGLVTAFPYVVRRSDSTAFRLYAVASALLGPFVAGTIALALVVWLANPVGLVGERAFLGVIAILLLVPLFGPVLLVARHHRRRGGDPRYDRALGLAGFGFVVALWVGLVISVPPAQQSEPTGVLAPVAAVLYGLPQSAAFLPPVLGAAGILLAHRLRR